MRAGLEAFPETEIVEFTVAPEVRPSIGLPHHEWLIAFAQAPANIGAFAEVIDQRMRQLNIYYEDLIGGNILQRLQITPLQSDAFIQYMKRQGKLGGQNKVPRLANDRAIADALHTWAEKEV